MIYIRLILTALTTNIAPHGIHQIVIIFLIGVIIGFLSGLLGKSGSAITTPALQVFGGVAPYLALASPLPVSLTNALSGSVAYYKERLLHKQVILLTLYGGVPATILGSYLSKFVSGNLLMIFTAIFVCGLGISFVLPILFKRPSSIAVNPPADPPVWKILTIAVTVGLLSGLLANGGGVLFAPLFIRWLKLPTKEAMATSLFVAGGLAIPGTLVHWWLGHIDWWIVLVLCIGSIPSAYLGAKVAIRMKNETLELIFGFALFIFGMYDIYFTLK